MFRLGQVQNGLKTQKQVGLSFGQGEQHPKLGPESLSPSLSLSLFLYFVLLLVYIFALNAS